MYFFFKIKHMFHGLFCNSDLKVLDFLDTANFQTLSIAVQPKKINANICNT